MREGLWSAQPATGGGLGIRCSARPHQRGRLFIEEDDVRRLESDELPAGDGVATVESQATWRLRTPATPDLDGLGVHFDVWTSEKAFADSGAIDFDSIDSLTDFYLSFGIDGLTILGIMGEAQKLSQDEALAVMRRFLQRVAGRVPIVVGDVPHSPALHV